MTDIKLEELLSLMPAEFRPGTEAYFLNGFHLARVRESLGGAPAVGSAMFSESCNGLAALGWDENKIKEAVEAEYTAIH